MTTIILIKECRKGRVFYSQKDIHHWENKNSSWRQYPVWFPRQRQNDNWPCPGHIVYGKRNPVCQGASKLNFPPHPAWKQWKNKDKTSWDMTWVWKRLGESFPGPDFVEVGQECSVVPVVVAVESSSTGLCWACSVTLLLFLFSFSQNILSLPAPSFSAPSSAQRNGKRSHW